jgi:hypothetical protein
MPTVVVSIARLTSSFLGVDDPEKIKRGIQYAHEHLSTRYVMLVGDAHWFPVRYLFMKDLSTNYPNHNPPATMPLDGTYVPSDLYYANLYHHRIDRSPGVTVSPGPFDDWDAARTGHYNEGTWVDPTNPNPDRVDGYPDVAVARLTAHSAADVSNYVNKIIWYETQRPDRLLFTFVADKLYPNSTAAIETVLAKAHFNPTAAFLLINNPATSPVPPRWVNASSAEVANKATASTWLSYLGHGSQQGWNGRDFGGNLVRQTASNSALPVVFAAGCLTGRFAHEAPLDGEYVDVTGARHRFALAPGADPDKPTAAAFVDNVSRRTWGVNCAGCNPTPLVAPKPNPYDFDRGNLNFAYPWLISYPQGGAIAYFGEVGTMEDWMAAELESYMLADYAGGQRNLGAIYLGAEREYWKHHLDDMGRIDFHSISRFYLGFMVMFGDPSLRMH